MIFQAHSDAGGQIIKILDDFANKSQMQVADRALGVKNYLDVSDKKYGCQVVVENGSGVPALKDALHLQEEPLCKGKEGSSAWITGCKPYCFRFGPSMYPLPGIGSYVRRCGEGSANLLVVPVAPLVDAGMIVLGEFGKFMNSESGAALLAKHGQVISWLAADSFALWVPYGWLPVHINTEETMASLLWVLPVLSGRLSAALEDSVWKPVLTLVQEHSKKQSGHDIWKNRLEAVKAVDEARTALKAAPAST